MSRIYNVTVVDGVRILTPTVAAIRTALGEVEQ